MDTAPLAEVTLSLSVGIEDPAKDSAQAIADLINTVKWFRSHILNPFTYQSVHAQAL